MKLGRLFVLMLLLLFIPATRPQDHSVNTSGLEVPPYQDDVIDLANILEPAEITKLKGKIAFLRLATTTSLAILIIPDLKGEALEEYSLRVANTWKLGRCDINNGVLLLLAMKDRAMRIAVGLGLESILTDEACRKVIDENIIPLFKAGNFYGGLDSGVTSIIEILTSSEEYRELFSRPCVCTEGGAGSYQK